VDEIFNRATSKESASKVTCMILSKDISVVVQGPIHKQDNLTKRVLESVRTHLPDAELILSTWKGSEVDGLNYDILVENHDPGTINNFLGSENFLRQVTSTFSGLQASSRKYVLKSRTDVLLSNCYLLQNVSSYVQKKPKFLSWYIFTIPKFFRNPRGFYKRLYHPSDVVQFGLRMDLLSLWKLDVPTNKSTFLTAEQYIWLDFLKKKGVLIDYDVNKSKWRLFRDIILSEKTLIEHFVILDEKNFSVTLPKKFEDIKYAPDDVYTEKEFNQLRMGYESHPIFTSASLLIEVYFNGLKKNIKARFKKNHSNKSNESSQSSRVLENS